VSDNIKGFTEIEGDYNKIRLFSEEVILVIVWRRNASAAVVEPVGRNAYWSENINAGGEVSSAGYMNVRTTSLSMVRVKTGVTEIGL